MWVFGYGKSSKRKKFAYAVEDKTRSIVSLHADAPGAIVEASKLELVDRGSSYTIRAIELRQSFNIDASHNDLTVRLALEDLPSSVRKDVEALRAGEAARFAERAERVRKIAETIREPWKTLNDEFKAKEARCIAAKQAAASSYIKDRSMSSARVREICDANDMALQASRDALKDHGEKLVRSAIGGDVEQARQDSSIDLEDVIRALAI